MSPSASSRTPAPESPHDGDLLAAIDLGSNSFHMVVAQSVLGQLRVVDRLRETVRLAEGLDESGQLAPAVQARALACLERFGQRIAGFTPRHVRAVATHSVRRLREPDHFLRPAETALGYAIDVISGREEARLIYLGVAHAQPPHPGQKRLVIDIGGGSTECIIGSGMQALERESLQVGCIASTLRFFPDGRLTARRWQAAQTEISAEFQQFAATYRSLGWDEAIGSSGTHKSIGEICAQLHLTKGAITAAALPVIRDRILATGRIDTIDLPGLSDERRPIIAGGVLILEAAFAALGLQRMQVSQAALREGVLFELLGRGGADDPRALSVAALMQRYGVDAAQATRVEATALHLFDQVAADWTLGEDARQMLAHSARLHEVGLALAHSGYHRHGAYVLQHSDIAGFSQQEQRLLAALVLAQRRKIGKTTFDMIPARLLNATRHTAALLRLAVLLHRARSNMAPPKLVLRVAGERLRLRLDGHWLQTRPLLRADLDSEQADMRGLGIVLELEID